MTSTQAWVSYLSRIELPVLANTLKRINELTDSNSSTVNELAGVIINDAQLTSQVLRLSNTVFYNQTRVQVSTVSRAITLIGFDSVKSMAISSLIVDSLLRRSSRPQLLRCLARAIHAAVQARSLLPKRNEKAQEEVFIGALLMNIGELVFWSCDTEQASELEHRLRAGDPATEAQKSVLHTTFTEITRGLAEAWALGPFIRDVVSANRANSIASSLARHAVTMAELAEDGWRSPAMDRLMETLGRELDENPAAIRDKARLNAGEAGKVAVSLGIPQVRELLTGATSDIEAPAPPPIDAELQLRILRELAQSLTEKPDLNTVFQLVLEGIQRGVGLKRVALLMSDREGRQLILRKCTGPDTGRWRNSLTIARDGSGPLGQLLPHGTCSVYHPPRQTPEQDFDPWLGRVPALTGPLLANGRMLGMFYADFGASGSAPTEEHLQAFSHFLQHAQLCLTLLSSQ
ncbi:MAG: HDOD domain-containing protein [Marinobacter sp.]